MKHAFVSLLAVLVILGGCATTGPVTSSSGGSSVYPPEISEWIAQNEERVISGVGTSDLPNTGDALRQARTLAMQDLASSLAAEVASISKDFVSNVEARGETDRIAQFNDAVGVKVQVTVEGVRTFGPYRQGSTMYIVRYIQKADLEKDIEDIARQHFAGQDEQLNRMLGL
jgi:hypothetical protein